MSDSTYKPIIIIPARLNSKRLPRKLLLDLAGIPVLSHTIRQAKKTQKFKAIYVATDSEEIAHVARQEKTPVIFTSSDCQNGSERIAQAAQQLSGGPIVNLQGDEPFVDPNMLDQMAEVLREPNIAMVSAMWPLQNWDDYFNLNVVKVVCNKADQALYFSRSPIPAFRDFAFDRQQKIPAHLQLFAHLGIYGFQRSSLFDYVAQPACLLEKQEKLEQLRMLYGGHTIQMLRCSSPCLGINSPEDLQQARARFKKS